MSEQQAPQWHRPDDGCGVCCCEDGEHDGWRHPDALTMLNSLQAACVAANERAEQAAIDLACATDGPTVDEWQAWMAEKDAEIALLRPRAALAVRATVVIAAMLLACPVREGGTTHREALQWSADYVSAETLAGE